MERAFKIVTSTLIIFLLLSALIHIILFVSDSEEYRIWIKTQIALQVFGAFLLLYIRNYKPIALVLFVIISVPFTYINVVHVNYGNCIANLILVPLFWVCYGSLIYSVRSNFIGSKNNK